MSPLCRAPVKVGVAALVSGTARPLNKDSNHCIVFCSLSSAPLYLYSHHSFSSCLVFYSTSSLPPSLPETQGSERRGKKGIDPGTKRKGEGSGTKEMDAILCKREGYASPLSSSPKQFTYLWFVLCYLFMLRSQFDWLFKPKQWSV